MLKKLILMFMLCYPLFCGLVWAKKTPDPVNNFLPPVATINPSLSDTSGQNTPDNDLTPQTLTGKVEAQTFKPSDPVSKLGKSILPVTTVTAEETANNDLTQEELSALWRATVDRNPIIRFSLDKLATPADLSPKYSSRFLSRTLNTVITGSAVAAMLVPGGGAYRNMGLMAGGDVLKNLINGKIAPRVGALTPTEQIQLSGLVDDLRSRLIQNYWDYRAALQYLQAASVSTQDADKQMSQATDPALKASKTVHYYRCRVEETTWLEKAKQHHIQLTRLAGEEAVKKLKWFSTAHTANAIQGVSP